MALRRYVKIFRSGLQLRSDRKGFEDIIAAFLNNLKHTAAPGTLKITWVPLANDLLGIVEWCEECE